jgi:hypothetical protein
MCICERKGRVARKVVIVLLRANPIKGTGETQVRGAPVAVMLEVGPEGRDPAALASTAPDPVKAGDRYEGTDLR